jgi:hypothetical protein
MRSLHPTTELYWWELEMGIASQFVAYDDPTCCSSGGRTPKKS